MVPRTRNLLEEAPMETVIEWQRRIMDLDFDMSYEIL
jgi:hypothetical protein